MNTISAPSLCSSDLFFFFRQFRRRFVRNLHHKRRLMDETPAHPHLTPTLACGARLDDQGKMGMGRQLLGAAILALVLHLGLTGAAPAQGPEEPSPKTPQLAPDGAVEESPVEEDAAADDAAEDDPSDEPSPPAPSPPTTSDVDKATPVKRVPPRDDAPAAAAEDRPPGAAPSPPMLQEAPAQILLRTDKSGALVPTPLFAPTDKGEVRQHTITWADIDRLLEQGAEQQNGRVTCQRVEIHGTSNGDRANLEIELTYKASPQRWVRAPLGLANAVITKYEAPEGGFLQYEESDGFVFWMAPVRIPAPASSKVERGAETEAPPPVEDSMMPVMPSLQLVERTIKIEASFAVSHSGAERRLSLRTPRAPAARLDLLVDTPGAQASLVGGETLVETRPGGTGGTQITAEGIGGDMVILWRPRRAPAMVSPPVLEAQGLLQVNLDENERVDCQVQLTVQSLGEPFDSFHVKFPPGMRLSPTSASEYEVAPVEEAEETNPQGPQRVEVRLHEPTSGPVTVRLSAASAPQTRQELFVEVGGFEVVEAVQEWGYVLVSIAGEHAINWVESPNVVQVDESPAPLRRADVIAARFRYFAQPFSLQIKAGPKKTRTHVEPNHLLEIASDHVRLTTTLKCRIHGAKANALRVDLDGWEVETVGGDDVVNPSGVKFETLTPLEIPFRTAIAGEVTVRLVARRTIADQRGVLRLPLPRVHADFLASAVVAVAPSDNLEITPLAEESPGLIPETPMDVAGSPTHRRASLFYRTRTGEPQPTLALGYEVKSGSTLVECDSEVRLREQVATVRQSLSYMFAYEPVKRLELEAPREVYESGGLQLLFEGEPIIPTPVGEPAGERIRLRLEPPVSLGRRRLTAEFSLPLPEIAAQQTVASIIPLIVPVFDETRGNARIGVNTMQVLFGKPLQAAPDESEWRVQPASAPAAVAGMEQLLLSGEGAIRQLPLVLTRSQPDQMARNAVDRMWLQTWLSALRRRDRVVFHLLTYDERLRIHLPDGADPASVIVFVNGMRGKIDEHFTSSSDPSGASVIVELTAFAPASEFVVELWYGFTAPRPRDWRTALEPPRLVNAGWVRRVFWHLILPEDEHLLASPPGMNAEQVWVWTGWHWRRRPLLDQRELEKWSDASEQPAPQSGNQYLFSAFGGPDVAEIYTARRSLAVLVLSGVTLLLGLRLMRAAGERQRVAAQTVFAGAVLAAAAAIAFPETSLLIAQGAALGVLCVLATWALVYFYRRQDQRHTTFPLAPSSQETASMRPAPSGGRRSSYATTATVPGPFASSSQQPDS